MRTKSPRMLKKGLQLSTSSSQNEKPQMSSPYSKDTSELQQVAAMIAFDQLPKEQRDFANKWGMLSLLEWLKIPMPRVPLSKYDEAIERHCVRSFSGADLKDKKNEP